MRWPFSRGDREQDPDRELQSHLEAEAREQREAGLSAPEPQHAESRAFGNLARVREETRDAWPWEWLDPLRQDVKQPLRLMRKSPDFLLPIRPGTRRKAPAG